MTYIELKAAVDAYFSDRSRSVSDTREGLENLRDELDMMIDSLPDED